MMFRLFVFLALIGVSVPAWAGDKPLYAAAPGWVLAAPAVDAATVADADPLFLVMDQQHRIEGGTISRYVDTATRIATTQVLSAMGTISLPWNPEHGDLIIHNVEILRGAERISLLTGDAPFSVLRREEKLEQGFVDGSLTATLAVQGLRVGDVLRVRFTITDRDPVLSGRVQDYAPLLTEPVPVKFGRLRIMWPAKQQLSWKTHISNGLFKQTEAGGFKEVTAKLPLPKVPDMPKDAPVRFAILPLLEATSFASWSEVASVMTPLYRTEGTIAPGSPLAAEVAKIAGQTDDPRLRAALALRLVQDEVRYLFNGMDGGNYVPQTPADTWKLRYGDCKAKSLLLTAILRELGIEAVPALVHSSLGGLMPDRLPAPAAFDHVIVRATVGGKTLWLDGTASGTRFEDVEDVPAFRNALLLRAGSSALVEMPLKQTARPLADTVIDIDASAGLSLPAPFKVRMALRGTISEMMRSLTAQANKDAVDKLADLLVADLLWDAQVDTREITYDDAGGATVIAISGVTTPEWTKERGRYRLTVDRAVSTIDFSPERARTMWSDVPVVNSDVDSNHVVTRIRLPGDGAGFALDGDQMLPPVMGGTELRRSVLLDGGLVTVDDRYATGTIEVASADIPAERAKLSRAKSRLLALEAPGDYPSRREQVLRASANGALEPLRAAYDKRIAAVEPATPPIKGTPATGKNPEVPEMGPGYSADGALALGKGYVARARFLALIGDQKGAVKDLSKMLSIAPSVEIYLWRSRLYSDLGDDKSALADARAARLMDPGSTSAIALEATLMGDTGSREQAIAFLREQIDATGSEEDLSDTLATLLGDAGQVDEALGVLEDMLQRKPGNPGLLNSRCWLKGTLNVQLDTALKDCTKSIALSEESAAALDSRGFVYFRLERWEDALADFDAALEQEPDLAASLFMRAVVRRRIGGAENLKAAEEDLAAARFLSPQVEANYAKWGVKL